MPRLRHVIALTAGTCALLATASPAQAVPRPAQPGGCVDVVFVGARGSGESAGLGRPVRDTADRYRNSTGSTATVEIRPVAYPAVSILGTNRRQYDKSVAAGATNIRTQLSSVTLKCPKTRYILAGYSQGAHAVTRFLESINTRDQRDRALVERIMGVTLFGSPVFAYDPPEQVNRSLRGPAPYNFLRQGVYLALTHAPMAERSVLSRPPWVARTHSYCLSGDVVCQASSRLYRLLNQLFGVYVPPTSIEPHSLYDEYYTQDAVSFLTGLTTQAMHSGDPRVSPFALRNSTRPAVSGVVGRALTITLAANGGSPGYRWDVNSDGLPPGLSHTGDDVITGTPEHAGSYQVATVVRDASGARSPVTITVRIGAVN